MKRINVKCPKCGANLEVKTANINVILPTIPVLDSIAVKFPISTKKQNEAEAKIKALRQAGVDVSNLFAIRATTGAIEVGRMNNGVMDVVSDDDPIFVAIRQSQTIPDRRLFRRWVMSQVFHMLTQKDYRTGQPIGFTAALRRKGYKYQWDMVVEELRVQSKLYDNDPENFIERNRWFNKAVVVSMAEDYITQVKKIVSTIRVRKCKGVPYVRLDGADIFVADLQSKVYTPLDKALKTIKNARTITALHKATGNFAKMVKDTYCRFQMDQSKAFKDAYKGAGAFFTLKNLILFHDCVFPQMDQEASMAYLNYLVNSKDFEGYKLFGVLKEFLTSNNIDIEAKQREWHN